MVVVLNVSWFIAFILLLVLMYYTANMNKIRE